MVFFREVFQEWQRDKTPLLAASLAYYATFSIGPAFLIAISLTGLVFGERVAQERTYAELTDLFGRQGADFIHSLVEGARNPAQGRTAAAIGILTLFLGAAGVFKNLQDALNLAWDVTDFPQKRSFLRGLMANFRKRALSFLMVLGVGLLLITSLVISAGISALDNIISDQVPESQWVLQITNQSISYVLATLLFATMYRVIPDVEIRWSDVLAGAAFTALLFSIGKYGLGLYLGNSSYNSTYGAAGSFVLVLAWIYYSSQILLFGAEFTQVYARRYGSHRVTMVEEST
jgi:membrane protein